MDAEASLLAVAEGDMAALERLYAELRVPVFAAALAISGDFQLAEDVLQETFVRVCTQAHTYRPKTRPRAWILTIARNLTYDALRRRQRESPTHDSESGPGTDTGLPAGDDAAIAHLQVTAALLTLEPLERQIVALHAACDLTHAEIAKVLDLPAGTVRWKYRVALERLRRTLRDERPEEDTHA